MAAGHTDVFHHVRDFPFFELPETLRLGAPIYDAAGHKIAFGVQLPEIAGLQITKFMVLQVVAGLLTLVIFRGLVRRARSGEPVGGRWWNFWETLALFIRDQVVRPNLGAAHHGHGDSEGHDGSEAPSHSGHATVMGGHPADKYLPFVWTCFFYILFCNLLGAIPCLGSATGEINVTGALAVTALGATILYGSREMGASGFWVNLVPSMDVPSYMRYFLVPMIWVIEFMGLLIKHSVLGVRLFANMMGGHTVVGVILSFIAVTANSWLFYLVMPSSIVGQVAIGLLELFVAFLQAYVFAFLATLFIGMATHPH